MNPNPQQVKNIVEAALLTAGGTLPMVRLQALFAELPEPPDADQIKSAIVALDQDYSDRGIEIKLVSSGYRIQARQEMGQWLNRLTEEKPVRYSRALLETLALIAYRQPITRAGVEDVRGVSVSSSIIKTLLEREWIKVVGHRDVPGRPALYGTTKQFLDYFNLSSLSELPELAELRNIDEIQKEFDLNYATDSDQAPVDNTTTAASDDQALDAKADTTSDAVNAAEVTSQANDLDQAEQITDEDSATDTHTSEQSIEETGSTELTTVVDDDNTAEQGDIPTVEYQDDIDTTGNSQADLKKTDEDEAVEDERSLVATTA